jgi:uncharacterized protein YjcR
MTVSDPLRVRDLAEELGVSPKTMRAWVDERARTGRYLP